MAQIRKIVRENPLSNFRQVAPDGGGAFRVLADGLNELYDRVAPVAKDIMEERGAELGRQQARARFGETKGLDSGVVATGPRSGLQNLIDNTEGGGRYDTLFGHSQRTGGAFAGVDVTKMTLDELSAFQDPSSAYGQWVKANNPKGVLATPIGRYQIVGTTLRRAAKEMGLSGSTVFTRTVQDEIFKHLALGRLNGPRTAAGKRAALRAEWDGFNHVPDAQLDAAIADFESGKSLTPGAVDEISGGAGEDLVRGAGDDVLDEGGDSQSGNVPSVMIRGSNGELEARIYSPYSGEILQAHNAAAQVAYVSEVYNKGLTDIMEMSAQYIADPEGFGEAAQGYVDQIVGAAPQDYKSEIRGVLEKEMVRRQMGIMEERQRDVRNRANNSSTALVERWSATLEEAIVSGDKAAIREAETALDGVLQAREALPGVYWTEEQSANVFIKARRSAETAKERKRSEAAAASKDHLDLIIKGAKNGATVKDEQMAFDPQVMADHPELAREAQAFLSLRDNMPEFLEMTPTEQAAAVARLAAEELSEEWQLDIVDAARKVSTASKKAWDDDPAARAFEVMKSDPPPTLPNLTPDEPEKFVKALEQRREYMNGIFEDGYTQTRAFLTQDEADNLQAFMGAETPPEIRAAMAAAIVKGFGQDAVTVFDEIDADTVTMFAGKMMAVGGNPALAATMLRGQQIMAEGLVRLPPKADQLGEINATVADAFSGLPGAITAQSEVMAAARAIYAAHPDARTIEPTSEAASELMAQSVQTALGQAKNKKGQVTGGVQTVVDHDTLLPVGVSGQELSNAIHRSMGGELFRGSGPIDRLSNMGARIIGGPEAMPEAWVEATSRDGFEGGPPLFNGKQIPPRYVNDGNIRIVPANGDLYRIEIISGSTVLNAEDADGNVFFFDPKKLIEAMR